MRSFSFCEASLKKCHVIKTTWNCFNRTRCSGTGTGLFTIWTAADLRLKTSKREKRQELTTNDRLVTCDVEVSLVTAPLDTCVVISWYRKWRLLVSCQQTAYLLRRWGNLFCFISIHENKERLLNVFYNYVSNKNTRTFINFHNYAFMN